VLYEPGMSCRQYVCFNLVHCVMFCWQINDDDLKVHDMQFRKNNVLGSKNNMVC